MPTTPTGTPAAPPQDGRAPPGLWRRREIGTPEYRRGVFLEAFSATSFFGIALVLACLLGVWAVIP